MSSPVPETTIDRLGQAWRVRVPSFGAEFIFRNISIAISEPHAEVAISHNGNHLLRSTSILSLSGRDKLAKTAAGFDSGDGPGWMTVTYAAVERMLEAEGSLTGGVDLRTTAPANPGSDMLVSSIFPAANTILVMPNEAGKSTLARALALSIVTGEEIIPGCKPAVVGPVLYVAGEDAFAQFHARALDELGRGSGVNHRTAPHPIIMYDTGGRSLARIANGLAERAVDAAAIFLDSHQALLGMANDSGIRDRDSNFWAAVDQIGKPTFTLAHPNRADRLNWDHADGSVAGSDVNQDRARCRWQGRWKDDDDPAMRLFRRRYTLECRKWTHGPKFSPVSFSIERFQGYGTEAWTTTFRESYALAYEGQVGAKKAGRPTKLSETADAYKAGATTPEQLAKVLDITYDAARMRLRSYKEDLQEAGE